MQNKLFVRNLSYNTHDSDLNGLFSQFGQVVSAKHVTDRDTGKLRGFGFVEMSDDQAAKEAIAGLNNTNFQGRQISVAVSEPQARRSQSGYDRN